MMLRGIALIPALVASMPAAAQIAAVPEPVVARTVASLAKEWRVSASMLRLEWRVPPASPPPDTSAQPQLLRGAAGWFTVAMPAETGRGVVRWAVRAGVAESVLVARRPLARGEVVAANDVADSLAVRWGTPTRGRRVEAGWVARRPIAPGEILAAPAVSAPPIVAAGDSVRFTMDRDGIQLEIGAVAARRADAIGDRIAVRLADGRILGGVVAGPRRVTATRK